MLESTRFGIKSLETRDPIPRHFTANYQVKKQFQLEEKETSIYHWQNVLFFLIFTSPWAHFWPLAVSQGHGRKSERRIFWKVLEVQGACFLYSSSQKWRQGKIVLHAFN